MTAPPSPDATTPTHAVIIPHYNDPERLARCLDALMPQAGPWVEVVVADNASKRSPEPVLARHPDVRLVVEPQAGAGLARNRGVAESRAPTLVFIDADCVPAPDWLARARETDAQDKVIGGKVTVFNETPPPRSGAEAFEAVFAFRFDDYIQRQGFTGAGNMITTRAVFAATGPFRTGLSEDKDWSQRAVAAGFALSYDPALVVGHPSRADWAALRRKWHRLTVELFGLRPPGARARLGWALRALAMPASVLVHAPRVLRAPGLSVGERARALATLARLRLLRMRWMLEQALTGRLRDAA